MIIQSYYIFNHAAFCQFGNELRNPNWYVMIYAYVIRMCAYVMRVVGSLAIAIIYGFEGLTPG